MVGRLLYETEFDTKEDALSSISEYKRYLVIMAYNKFYHLNLYLVPTISIDKIWHFHILQTNQYILDCNNIFGCYMHHNPQFSSFNNEEAFKYYIENKQKKGYTNAQNLYIKLFNNNDNKI